MCGFIGSLSENKISEEELDKCNKNIICRGPDSKKTTFQNLNDKYFSATFNRLSILDLSNLADQPMSTSDDNYLILFNGEIYNHQELKNDLLKKGYKFRTNHSDTESLLYLLIDRGIEAVQLLRGQFSFVFLDKKNNTLLLARDRVGQKPLFFTENNNSFSFSSNLISLAKLTQQNTIEESSIYDYLQYGKTISPKTVFQNIYEVKPGQILKVNYSEDGFNLTFQKYWDLLSFYDNKKFDEDEFIELFSNSVDIRTKPDVPYATFLSGGLDSTSIVKSQHDLGYEINTFSVYMGGTKFDESIYCEEVSKKFNTNHISIEIKDSLSIKNLPDLLNCLDQPYSDPSIIPTQLISREISNYFKMAISGDGGDELLGGYLRVQKSLFNSINQNFSNLYNYYPAHLGTGNIFLSKDQDIVTRYNSYLSDVKLLNLLGIKDNEFLDTLFKPTTFDDDYKSLMKYEYEFYLPQMMMYKVDRASMYNSVEVRSPFVDNKLIEYIFSHSYDYFDSNNQKQVLKKYLSLNFKEEFLNRKKQGFVFDLKDFVNSNNDFFKENIIHSNKIPYIETNKLSSLFKYKTRINADRIWKLFVLNYYLEQL